MHSLKVYIGIMKTGKYQLFIVPVAKQDEDNKLTSSFRLIALIEVLCKIF